MHELVKVGVAIDYELLLPAKRAGRIQLTPSGTFYLPTEFVVRGPKLAVPTTGRWWALGVWWLNGEEVGYHTLAALPGFEGTAHFDELYLVEDWENWGDDGHVEFRLKGYFTTYGEARLEYLTQRHTMGWQAERAAYEALVPGNLN